MARIARGGCGGLIYHVLNRGNDRKEIFFDERDYELFLRILKEGQEKVPIRILSYCIMPNHWHLVLWPEKDGDLSKFMHWISFSHTNRYHKAQGSCGTGHVYQGRYKSFPVKEDKYLINVAKYVERNALRAGFVTRAESWRWNSLHQSHYSSTNGRPRLDALPIVIPEPWVEYVNIEESDFTLREVRKAVERCRPFGDKEWVDITSSKLGLRQALRSRGRPRAMKMSR